MEAMPAPRGLRPWRQPEGARLRRERRLRGVARLQLALARGAAALAGHRGGPPAPDAARRLVKEEVVDVKNEQVPKEQQVDALQAELAEKGKTTESTNYVVAELRSQLGTMQQRHDTTLQQAKQFAMEKQEEIEALQAQLSVKGEIIESANVTIAELRSRVEEQDKALQAELAENSDR